MKKNVTSAVEHTLHSVGVDANAAGLTNAGAASTGAGMGAASANASGNVSAGAGAAGAASASANASMQGPSRATGTASRRQATATSAFGLATNEENRAQKVSRAFTLVLFLLIVVTLLVALVIGTNVYRSLTDARSQASNLRLETSLLMNNIRMNDEIDAVGVGEGPEGRALVLTERLSSGSYETRLYKYQGYIVQEYAVAENPYTPERAAQIVESDTFDFEYSHGLLTIHTDSGSTSVALRSVRGGA